MTTAHIKINLDEEIMRLRQIQATLKMSETAFESAFRIFMYACELPLTTVQTQMHLMSASVYFAVKELNELITLKQISATFGVPKMETFWFYKRILAQLLPQIESRTIATAETLIRVQQQYREKKRAKLQEKEMERITLAMKEKTVKAESKDSPSLELKNTNEEIKTNDVNISVGTEKVGTKRKSNETRKTSERKKTDIIKEKAKTKPKEKTNKKTTIHANTDRVKIQPLIKPNTTEEPDQIYGESIRSTHQREKNTSIEVYAIDINNILTSFTRKYHSEALWRKKFSHFLKRTAGSKDCQMFLFASRPAERYIQEAKKYPNVTVFIETNLKSAFDHKYMDIDTMLCVEMTRWVLKNSERIRRFYIASGDKDFHTLVEMVREEGIPVTVLIEDKKFWAETLVEAANSVKMILN